MSPRYVHVTFFGFFMLVIMYRHSEIGRLMLFWDNFIQDYTFFCLLLEVKVSVLFLFVLDTCIEISRQSCRSHLLYTPIQINQSAPSFVLTGLASPQKTVTEAFLQWFKLNVYIDN